jgi:HSP20 family protein
MRFRNFDLQNWDPFRQLSSLRQEIDRLFDEPLASANAPQSFWLGGGWPSVDVQEDRDNVVVTVEVPGMKKEDIDVSLHDGVLSISGERTVDAKYEVAEAHRTERFSGRFQRSFALPVLVNTDKANAAYQDGVLTITLPKAEEAKPKQITVHAD